ncbi:hypothetical protein [Methanococcoides methylutens]|uniref:Uncharacterized protein n=1 Tax=Methanococcoides methylutens MM1 TaxID=1434104 RepID=A0A0E3SS60_METMT|nr:hypothetical protein [Methanococcoides methylutens]AKB85298.1 hypothetical protein MCMEM_1245 [Methanococcoides methylutens MM1]
MKEQFPMRYIESKSRMLVNTPLYFFLFMLFTIAGTLVYYLRTEDEFAPAIILSFLWLIFWKNSKTEGRTFLVMASVFGYIHELVGVQYGYFTYLNGIIGNVPIWILPGYGAIFWSSYNLWKIFEKQFSESKWFHFTDHFIILSLLVLVLADYSYFDLLNNPLIISVKFIIAFMLIRNFDLLRLAYFTGAFTLLNEISGEILGTWSHRNFSLLSLMAGYIFLLWLCLSIAEVKEASKGKYHEKSHLISYISTFKGLVDGRKEWTKREATAAFMMISYYTLSLLGIIDV